MIQGLSIHNLLLIDDLHLEFAEGFNILTGETGAGKSVLLDSLGFALGFVSIKSLKSNVKPGEVTLSFQVSASHPVRNRLEEFGFQINEELLIRRALLPTGRTRSFINESRCTLDVLKEVGLLLVDIHGQYDTQQITDSNKHRSLLDSFGHLEGTVSQVQDNWTMYQEHLKKLYLQKDKVDQLKKNQELTEYYLEEFDNFDLKPDEVRQLEIDRSVMKFSSQNREMIDQAEHRICSDGALGNVSEALTALERIKGDEVPSIELAKKSLERALIEIQETENHLNTYRHKLNFDPNELERLEDRVYAIRNLARKHNVLPEELYSYWEKLKKTQTDYQKEIECLNNLQKNLTELENKYNASADTLSKERSRVACQLDTLIKKEFKPLKLNKAEFRTALTKITGGPKGYEDVRFLVTTNPGFPLGPIDQIASGGELSRFLLALKVCLTEKDSGMSLIFDEIDTGIGGATADAVGKRLSALATKTQVIAITHSPQVAALGNLHYKIDKHIHGTLTAISAQPLSQNDRVEEIARMLAAESITAEAKEAARVLLGIKN